MEKENPGTPKFKPKDSKISKGLKEGKAKDHSKTSVSDLSKFSSNRTELYDDEEPRVSFKMESTDLNKTD